MAYSLTGFAGERRGVWHPTDCIVQVIDDRADAEAATHPAAIGRDDRLLAIADVTAAYRAHKTI